MLLCCALLWKYPRASDYAEIKELLYNRLVCQVLFPKSSKVFDSEIGESQVLDHQLCKSFTVI